MRFPCFTKQSYLPFAKSSAAVREEQRGRSRRAAQSFANGNTNGKCQSGKTHYEFLFKGRGFLYTSTSGGAVRFCTLPTPYKALL